MLLITLFSVFTTHTQTLELARQTKSDEGSREQIQRMERERKRKRERHKHRIKESWHVFFPLPAVTVLPYSICIWWTSRALTNISSSPRSILFICSLTTREFGCERPSTFTKSTESTDEIEEERNADGQRMKESNLNMISSRFFFSIFLLFSGKKWWYEDECRVKNDHSVERVFGVIGTFSVREYFNAQFECKHRFEWLRKCQLWLIIEVIEWSRVNWFLAFGIRMIEGKVSHIHRLVAVGSDRVQFNEESRCCEEEIDWVQWKSSSIHTHTHTQLRVSSAGSLANEGFYALCDKRTTKKEAIISFQCIQCILFILCSICLHSIVLSLAIAMSIVSSALHSFLACLTEKQ